MSQRITRVRLCQWFPGWTLEYVDDLLTNDPFTVADIMGVLDADSKLNQPNINRKRR